MKIIKEVSKYHKYAFEFEFNLSTLDFCRFLKDKYGWTAFSFFEKKWRFNDIKIIEDIKQKYPHVEMEDSLITKEELLKKELEKIKEEKSEELKKTLTSDIEIKGIKYPLYDYQRASVELIMNSEGKMLLSADCGTGKTIISLGYCTTEGLNKILVVCPSVMKYSWKSEVEKFTNYKAMVIDSKTKLTLKDFNDSNVFIINYDILKKFFEFLSSVKFDIVIYDESQSIKSISSIRSKLSKKIAVTIPRVLFLTGTPVLNTAADLYNPLNIMRPKEFNNFYQFTKRYANGRQGFYGWEYFGASNIDELRTKMAKNFIRIRKEDVLKDLPEKIFIDLPVELNNEKQFEYDLVLDNFVTYLREVKNKKDPEIRRTIQAEKITQLNALRQISALGKIDSALELADELIESGEKVLIFTNYKEPVEKLKQYYKDICEVITGDVPDFMRKEAIDSFQNDDKIKVFIGTIAASGVGITLTKASCVIFLDLPWRSTDIEQCYSRCDRLGNENEHIKIYYTLGRNTIDYHMKEVVNEKQKIIDKLVDNIEDVNKTQGSMIDAIVNNIEKENNI